MREDTQKAIKEYKISVSIFKKSIEAAEEYLSASENVLFVSPTNFDITYKDPTKRNACAGVVFLTNERMLLYYKPKDEAFTDVTPLSELGKVTVMSNPALGGNSLVVEAYDRAYKFTIAISTSFRLSDSVYKDMLKAGMAFEYARDKYGKGTEAIRPEAGQTAAAAPAPDIPQQIEKLAELKDKGILSEEEFQSKKAELLSRL